MFPVSPFPLIAACRLFHSPAIDELQEATEADTARAGPSRPGPEVIDLPTGVAKAPGKPRGR